MNNKLSLPELLHQLTARHTEKVKVAITDIDGVLRGKVISFDKFGSITKGFGFAMSCSAGMPAIGPMIVALRDSIPAIQIPQAVIDPTTFRQVPWDGLPFFWRNSGECSGGWR